LGTYHKKTADTYDSIGKFYFKVKNFEKAEEYYQTGLSIKVKLYGEESKDTSKSYGNLASLYKHLKDYEKSEELLKK